MPWNVSLRIYIHLIGRTIAANDLEQLFPEQIMVSTTFPYLADTAAATAVTLAYVVWDTHFHIDSRKGRWWSAIGVYTLASGCIHGFVYSCTTPSQWTADGACCGQVPLHVEGDFHSRYWGLRSIQPDSNN